MNITKLIYYGFGGFIGFVCAIVINLIFMWVEESGNPILSDLVRNHGTIGRYLIELFHNLPIFGVALGVILVRILFQDQWKEGNIDQ
jgi:hypothetical protein